MDKEVDEITLMCTKCGQILLRQQGDVSMKINKIRNNLEVMRKTMRCNKCGVFPVVGMTITSFR